MAPEGAGLAWVFPSPSAETRRTLHSRTDSPGSHDALARAIRGGTSGVAAPAPVPARPHHPPGSGWQSAKRLNGTEPPAPPRPDQHSLLAPPPARVTRDPGIPASAAPAPSCLWPRRLSASGSSWGEKYLAGNFSQHSPAGSHPRSPVVSLPKSAWLTLAGPHNS